MLVTDAWRAIGWIGPEEKRGAQTVRSLNDDDDDDDNDDDNKIDIEDLSRGQKLFLGGIICFCLVMSAIYDESSVD